MHKQPGERMVAVPQELCIGAINDEVGGVVRERCTRAYYMSLRKCLILFAWRRAIPDLYTMLREPKQPSPNLLEGVRRRLTLFSAVIQIPNSISDDLYCASRLGLVGTKMGAVAEKYGAMLWWTDTFLQLNVSAISESHNRAQLKKLQSRQEYLQQCLDDLTHGDTLKPEYAISDDTLGAFLRTDADIRKVQTGQSWARLSAFKLMCDFVFVCGFGFLFRGQ